MIGPLVDDTEFTRKFTERGDAVFRQHGKAETVNKLGNSVINFRIQVVRSAAQHNGSVSVRFDFGERFLCQRIVIVLKLFLFFPCRFGSKSDFPFLQAPCFQFFFKARDNAFVVIKGQKRADKWRLRFRKAFVHVVFNDFRVRHDHGAVKVIIFAAFLRAVLDARIENTVDFLFQQIGYVPVDEFGRIAGRVGRNSVHCFLEEVLRRLIGKDDFIPEFGKECKPERIVFVHIENAGNADGTARRFFKRFVVREEAVVF